MSQAIKNQYSARATITITLTSLGNGNSRESTVIDNTGTLYKDLLVRVQTNGQAGGTGLMHVFAYASLGDTTYSDGATGSDAAFTTANRLNSRYVGSVQMNGATAVKCILPSVAQAFGGVLPDKVGFIFDNESGNSLSATGGEHVVEYEGVTEQVG